MEHLDAERRGEIAANISRQAVQIVRDYTGRGPTKAKTLLNTELVTIALRDTLTKGERRLIELDRADHVLATRREYQTAMRDDLVEMVERETGREVIAFMSDNHIDPDIALESFVLVPPPASEEEHPPVSG
jgi:uncharacterized protein YbcI